MKKWVNGKYEEYVWKRKVKMMATGVKDWGEEEGEQKQELYQGVKQVLDIY